MASFIRRGNTWRAMIRRKGRSVSATFDSRAEAEEWATQAESAIIRGARAASPVVLPVSTTPAILFDRYSKEVSPTKKGERWERIRLRKLALHPIFNRPLAIFGAPDVSEWRDQRLLQVSALTVNREMNLISAVLNQALKEWRVPLALNPVHQVMRPKNPKPRTRRISESERERICLALGWDRKAAPGCPRTWTAWAFCFALETAMRKGEILRLTRDAVDLPGCCAKLRDTKNGDDRDVPLSTRAVALLALLRPGPARGHLVPITSATLDMTFRRAKIAAGLADLRFHDSRREAATTMSQKLANVLELAAVTGHRDLKTLKIYYSPKASDLAKKLG